MIVSMIVFFFSVALMFHLTDREVDTWSLHGFLHLIYLVPASLGLKLRVIPAPNSRTRRADHLLAIK